jgi:hypothetical protein
MCGSCWSRAWRVIAWTILGCQHEAIPGASNAPWRAWRQRSLLLHPIPRPLFQRRPALWRTRQRRPQFAVRSGLTDPVRHPTNLGRRPRASRNIARQNRFWNGCYVSRLATALVLGTWPRLSQGPIAGSPSRTKPSNSPANSPWHALQSGVGSPRLGIGTASALSDASASRLNSKWTLEACNGRPSPC